MRGRIFIALLCVSSMVACGRQFSSFQKSALPPASGDGQVSMLVDFDGDGDLDVLIGHGPAHQNRLYGNDGRGRFTEITQSHLPADKDHTAALATGDVDGDGDADLVCGNGGGWWQPRGQQNRLYDNRGKGVYVDVTASRFPKDADTTRSLVLGDVDGDGDLDLVGGNGTGWPSRTGQQNRLYLNDGKGTFADRTPGRLPVASLHTTSVALGDVDLDGDLDLICGNYGSQNRLYANDGNGTFTDVTASRMPPERHTTQDVALVDVDRDGDLDLFCSGDYLLRLYLNNGGVFTDRTKTHVRAWCTGSYCPGHEWDIALADVDDDGDVDLVGLAGYLNIYRNDGTGRFAVGDADIVMVEGGSMALGDLDADRDPDLAVGVRWGKNFVALNLHRHLYATSPARIGKRYPIEIYSKPGYATGNHLALPLIALGGSRQKIPPFGVLGVDLSKTLIGPTLVITQKEGQVTLPLVIPNLQGLVGHTLHTQALAIPDPKAPLASRFTNVMADRIGR